MIRILFLCVAIFCSPQLLAASFNQSDFTSGSDVFTLSWNTSGTNGTCRIVRNDSSAILYIGNNTLYTETDIHSGTWVYTLSCYKGGFLGPAVLSQEDTVTVTVTAQESGDTGGITEETPGSLTHTAKVNSKGEATIKIDLPIPAGVASLKPQLSVSYNSNVLTANRGGGGFLGSKDHLIGFGWRLDGFSKIHICQLGYPNGVGETDANYSKGRLCLDGSALQLVSGTDTYYLEKNQGIKVKRIGTSSETNTFEVTMPNGTVREYGTAQYSKERVPSSNLYPIHGWYISKTTDVFGNTIRYSYLNTNSMYKTYPQYIYYGDNEDVRIKLNYTDREVNVTTADWKFFAFSGLTLSKIEIAVKDSSSSYRAAREYTFNQVVGSAFSGNGRSGSYLQLDSITACGFDVDSVKNCFKPIKVEWDSINSLNYVSAIEDGFNKRTRFVLDQLKSSNTNSRFTETPFGSFSKPSNVQDYSSTSSYYAVKELYQSNGIGGERKKTFSYYGNPIESKYGYGTLGFAAQKITDTLTGVVTYNQLRFDAPFQGKLAQQLVKKSATGHVLSRKQWAWENWTKKYSTAAPIASKFLGNSAYKVIDYTVDNIYPKYTNEFSYESGSLVSVKETYVSQSFDTNGFVNSQTTTQTISSSGTPAQNAGVWGKFNQISTGSQLHKTIINSTLSNNISATNWLIGFETYNRIRKYNQSNSLHQDITNRTTRYGNTNLIATLTKFENDADLELTKTYQYSGSGLVTNVETSGQHIESNSVQITNFQYGRFPSRTVNDLGHVNQYTYDLSTGHKISETDPNHFTATTKVNGLGQITQTTDHLGVTSKQTRFFCGNTCPSYAQYSNVFESDITPTKVIYFDSLGREIETKVKGLDGQWIYKTHQFNSYGHLWRESQPHYSGNAAFTTYTYDNYTGRKTNIAYNNGGSLSLSYSYNSSYGGTRVKQTRYIKNHLGSSIGSQTKYIYHNRLGEVVNVTEAYGSPEQVASIFTYDGVGNLTSTVVNGSLTVSAEFDDAGNRTLLVDPSVGTVTTKYNARNQVRWESDNSGQITTTTYDSLGREKTQSTNDGVQYTYYDPNYNVGGINYQLFDDALSGYSHKQQYYYHTNGLLKQKSTQIDVSGFSRRYYYQYWNYDTYGRLDEQTAANGFNTVYKYNNENHLYAIDDSSGNRLKEIIATDAFGNPIDTQLGEQISVDKNTNNTTGILEAVYSTNHRGTLQNNSYDWQTNGVLESRTNHQLGYTEYFEYDNLNRLENAKIQSGSVIKRQLSTSFDIYGNITNKDTTIGSGSDVNGYIYGQNGASNNAVTYAQVNGVSQNLSYDLNGQITRYDSTSNNDDKWLDWNSRGKPTRITRGISHSNYQAQDNFAYGINGSRYYRKTSWKDKNGILKTEHTFYIGSDEDVITNEAIGITGIKRANYGFMVVNKKTLSSGSVQTAKSYLLSDHLGSIEKIVDENGYYVNRAYDPYGERRDANWLGVVTASELIANAGEYSLPSRLGYTGHEHLDGTGMIHMNGRVYDPLLGRFLSPDLLIQAPYYSQSYNRYTYVFNNPMAFYDPSGYAGTSNQVGQTETGQTKEDNDDSKPKTVLIQYIDENGKVTSERETTKDEGLEEAISAINSGAEVTVGGTTYGIKESGEIGDNSNGEGSDEKSYFLYAVENLAPGYELGACILGSSCNKSEWFLAVVTIIPIAKAVKLGKKGVDAFSYTTKVTKSASKFRGRSGKQARLREMMNDPKVSSADRGWLKNDARHIKYGNKSGLRIPRNGRKSPGRKAQDKGYELAHPHNAPASQGNNYAGSKLKNHADHKVETRLHRHRY